MSSATADNPLSTTDADKCHGWPKAHTSAVVIIPPESCWTQIQDIRSKHDRAYNRWMPHINLLYPFIVDDPSGEAFATAADVMRSALEQVASFRIRFSANSFRFFRHGKNCTLWLKPLAESQSPQMPDAESLEDYSNVHEGIIAVQKHLQDTFPNCSDLSLIGDRGFTPHLSLGQFRPRDVEPFVSRVKPDWTEIEFVVSEVALISRGGRDDPFAVRKTVPLAK